MGNRAQKTDSATGSTSYSYDAANRLLTAGANTYQSDTDGNTLTDGTRTNVWDSQNRLASCTSGGVTSTYTYGADGLRRTSTVNGVTTYYVYDGQTLVQEMQTNAQGQLQTTATYLQGPRGTECRVDETRQTEAYYLPGYRQPGYQGTPGPWVNPNHADGMPFGARGKTVWYVYDGLGSVVGEVDVNGNLTSSGTFDVYGAKRQGGTGTSTSRQGFVGSLGHVSDAETGLVYMRARYYDPSTGRFVSEDPGAHGINWFVYCDNNPTNRVDSSGKSSEDLTGPQMASSMLFDIGAVLTMAAWAACMTPCPPMAVAVMVGAAVIAFTLAFDFSGTETSISASVLRDVTGFAAAGASAYEIVNWFRASADMEDKMPVASGKVLAAAVTLYGMEVYGAVNAVDN